MRTAKDLGIKTVAVYSEPDANAQHVKMVKRWIYNWEKKREVPNLLFD